MISHKIKVGQTLYSYSYKGHDLIIQSHVVKEIEGEFIIVNGLRNRYDMHSLFQEYYSHDSPKELYRSEQELKDSRELATLSRNIQDTIERGGCLNLDKARKINSILLEK